MLNYHTGKEWSLTSCHLVAKITQVKDEESSLREQEVLHLGKEDSCIFREASTVSLRLLIAEAKILFD